MKKWLCLLLAGALTFSLAACYRSQNVDTPSDATGTNAHTSPSNATEDTKTTDATDTTLHLSPSDTTEETGTEPNKENPYAIREITDETVVITGDKKIFNNSQITLSVPADWKCLTAWGEDNVVYYFQDPVLGDKCQFSLDVTFSIYIRDRTRDEYLQSFSRSHEDVVIDSLAKEAIQGSLCTKVVHSYTEDNTNFIRILYDNLTEGPRLYDFVITYPASERSTYEPVFESIIDSIQFIHAN